MKGLKSRNALVTGAADGIGRAIALRLAEEGCIVGILDLNEAGGAAVAAAIGEAGGRAFSYRTDIADYAQVESAVARFTKDAGGPIHYLVNNAGWDKAVSFLDSDRPLWDKVIAINLYGPLNLHHIVVRQMAEAGFGRVVNIASDAGRVGSSGEAVYSACKGGIISFTKTLARELVSRDVHLNCVCPGPTDTAILRSFFEGEQGTKIVDGLKRAIPMRRLGSPDDYPGIVAFLLSDDAGYMTGQVVSVSGGLTMHG